MSASTQNVTIFDDTSTGSAVQLDAASLPGTRSVVIVGGSDGTNVRAVKTATDGTLFSAQVNRDGTRVEAAFGSHLVDSVDPVFASSFVLSQFEAPVWRYSEGAATFTFVNGKARLSSGTGIARAVLHGEPRQAYVPGVGMHITVSAMLGDTGASGCIRNWGSMSPDGLNGYFFQLNGTTLNVVRRSNGVDTAVAADSWNVINSITPDLNGHIWEIVYQWLGVGRIIFKRDGKEVHIIEYVGTSSELSSLNPNQVPWAEVLNTSGGQAAARNLDIGCLSLQIQNSLARYTSVESRAQGNTSLISCTSGTAVGLLAFYYRPSWGVAGVKNQKVARITKITASGGGGGTSSTLAISVVKNPVFGAMTWLSHEAVNNPTTDHAAVVPTIAFNGVTAGGTGYANTNVLRYKITGFGPSGETLPSTTTATITVGATPQQVLVTFPAGLAHATAYGIYRSVNSAVANQYFLVGISPTPTFVDDAFQASTVNPPGSNNTDGSSAMAFRENVPGGGGANQFVASTGRVMTAFIINGAGGSFRQEYGSDRLVLKPNETLLITATSSGNNQVGTCFVEWEEGDSR